MSTHGVKNYNPPFAMGNRHQIVSALGVKTHMALKQANPSYASNSGFEIRDNINGTSQVINEPLGISKHSVISKRKSLEKR